MLTLSTLACCCGIRDYRQLSAIVAETADPRRDDYESSASHFARQQSYLDDPNVPWSRKICGKLQTRWLAMSAICGVRGDPWRRPQRVLIILVHVLLTMALSILFYQSDLPECPKQCDTANVTNATMECACKTVDCECLPNGLQASLLTAALVLPVIAVVNICYAKLREPLMHDMASKSGQLLLYLQQQRLLKGQPESQDGDSHEDDATPGKKVSKAGLDAQPGLYAQCCNCLAVQRRCLLLKCCRRRYRVRVSTFHPTATAVDDSAAPRHRAKVGIRRQLCSEQMVLVARLVDSTFVRHDRAAKGWLDLSELVEFLVELNGGTLVPTSEAEYIQAQCDDGDGGVGGSGSEGDGGNDSDSDKKVARSRRTYHLT